MTGSVTVRVPATTANLGPGYDAFGLALSMHNTFTARLADAWHVEVIGQGEGELSRGADNRVAEAMATVFAEAGHISIAAELRCENAVPPGRGLGSSSSAIVGGLLLADRLCGAHLGRERLLELAVELEGHPDNVAAAMFGGLTLCWREGRVRCAPLSPARGLAAVVAIPETTLDTKSARAMLPTSVSHEDASFNAGRAGLVVAGLLLGRADLLAAGMHDRLHEQYREVAITDLEPTRTALLEAGADAAALSGAGPAVVGITTGDDDTSALERARSVASAAQPALGSRRRAVAVAIDRTGAAFI
jgi:homoserine kinase